MKPVTVNRSSIAVENSEEADKFEIRPEGSDQAACKAALFWI